MSSQAVAEREDHVGWFLTYLAFGGDLVRCQHVLQVPLERLQVVSAQFDWPARLRKELGDDPNTVGPAQQRMLNRVTNFVQAHKLRSICDQLLVKYSDPAALDELTTEYTKNGANKTLAPLKDLAATIEIAQRLTRESLGDSHDRTIEESSGDQDPKKVAKAVADAMRLADSTGGKGSMDIVKEVVEPGGVHGQRRIGRPRANPDEL